jgi:hypothetical protein
MESFTGFAGEIAKLFYRDGMTEFELRMLVQEMAGIPISLGKQVAHYYEE